ISRVTWRAEHQRAPARRTRSWRITRWESSPRNPHPTLPRKRGRESCAEVVREVAPDRSEIELLEDRLLRLALEQKGEAIAHELFNRPPAAPTLDVLGRRANHVVAFPGCVRNLHRAPVAASIVRTAHLERHRL